MSETSVKSRLGRFLEPTKMESEVGSCDGYFRVMGLEISTRLHKRHRSADDEEPMKHISTNIQGAFMSSLYFNKQVVFIILYQGITQIYVLINISLIKYINYIILLIIFSKNARADVFV